MARCVYTTVTEEKWTPELYKEYADTIKDFVEKHKLTLVFYRGELDNNETKKG